ncbi:MAG: TIGR02996 domain-containing protein [Kofleriaceae bacterium]
MRILAELDLPSLRIAYRSGAPDLTFAIGDAELALGPVAAYLERFHDRERENLLEVLARQVHRALTSDTGYGFEHVTGRRVFTCLAVRAGDRVVAGIQASFRRTPFPNPGWNVGKWFAEPVRNVKGVTAWAADPARTEDTVAIPVIVRAAAAADPARGRELLAAVLADPDDLDCRLVYADWLLEQADVRGELIRLQCELETIPLRDPRRAEIRSRERTLLLSMGSLIGDVEGIVEKSILRRGLLDAITIRVPALARHGAELVATHPIRRARILVDSDKQFAQLRGIPALAKIPQLEISGRPKDYGKRRSVTPEQLIGSRPFHAATELTLAGMDVRNGAWLAFLNALDAPRLRTLGLVDCNAGEPELALLAASFPTLDTIRLDDPQGSSQSLTAHVTALIGRPNLRELSIASFRFEDAHHAELVAAIHHHAPALTSLTIRGSVGRRTIEALRALLATRRLDRLELGSHHVTVPLLVPLLSAPELANLGELVIPVHARDDEHDVMIDALLAGARSTLIDWFWGTQLSAERLAKLLEHVDVVRRLADGSVDLVDRVR